MIILKALLFLLMVFAIFVFVVTCMAGLWPLPVFAFAASAMSYYAGRAL